MSEQKGFGIFKPKAGAKSAVPPAAPVGQQKPKDVRKRWIMLGGGLAVVFMVGSTLMRDEPSKMAAPAKKPEQKIEVNPKGSDEKAFTARYGQDLQDLKTALEAEKQARSQQEQMLKDIRAQLSSQQVKGAQGASDNTGGLSPVGTVPAPPKPPTSRDMSAGATQPAPLPPGLVVPGQSTAPQSGAQTMPPSVPPVVVPSVPVQDKKTQVFDAPERKTSDAGPDVNAKVSYVRNPNAGTIGLGFVGVSLLNGVEAGTSQSTQSNPLPILLNVMDHATLPGLDRYQMRNCFMLGTGYGEPSSERVQIRVSKISCVDKQNKLSLTAEVSGAVADSDGKLGLRGVVIDRQGAKLFNSVLAGFASGLSSALSQGQSQVTTSSLTGNTTSVLQGSAVARAAGLSGAQTAANQLAEFYLKEAQAIFPVISIDAGRRATVMFTGTSKLVWASTESQYVQQVTPTGL